MSGERERAERLKRLLAVQAQKRKLEEWRLADLKRGEGALRAASAQIIESLGDQSLLHGLFLEAKATTLRRNEAKILANLKEQEAAERRLVDAQTIEKRVERASEEAGRLAARKAEEAELAAILDEHLAARSVSLE